MKRYTKPPSLKELERDLLEAKRLRYPNNPYLVPDTFRDDKAGSFTKAIIAYLRLKGHQAERINTTGRLNDTTKIVQDVIGRSRIIGSIQWIPGTGTNGSADISATVKGRSVKIEIKIGNDRQSAAQKEYQKAIQTAFGIYYIARDFQSFVSWFNLNFEKP